LDRGIITQDEFEAIVYSHRAAFAAVEFEPRASDSHAPSASCSNPETRVEPSSMLDTSKGAIGGGEIGAKNTVRANQSLPDASAAAAGAVATMTPSKGEMHARVVATGRTRGDGTVILRSVVAGYLYQMTGSTAPVDDDSISGDTNTLLEKVEDEGSASSGSTRTTRTTSVTSMNAEGSKSIFKKILGSNAEHATLCGAPLGFVGSLFLLEISDAPTSSSMQDTGVASVLDAPPGARLLWAR
jgi:hypothetical protein